MIYQLVCLILYMYYGVNIEQQLGRLNVVYL